MAMVILLAGRLPLQSPFRLALSTNPAQSGSCASCKVTQLSMKRGAVLQATGSVAAESEEQRLQLDAEARSVMAAVAEAQAEEAPGAWKWAIRKRVWDLLESENLAQLPRPVHHRIPNFVGAGAAAAKLASLPAFEAARCVKVNPDTPQKQVRFLTLNGNKILMTPQPRLRTGFFSILESSSIPHLPDACTSAGVAKFGKPISLDDKIKVDLIVIGSVAVDPATGARLGKGEGFAELEYGILRWMGAIDDSTLVVTTVHDQQLVDDIPLEKLLIHDVPVDIICTPTQIIHTNTKIPKPQGIYWEKLSRQKLAQIRVLQDLKKRIEKETGEALPSAPDELLPPVAARKRPPPQGKTRRSPAAASRRTVFMWNVSPSTTKRELLDHVADQAGGNVVQTVRTSLKPGSNRQLAWVILKDGADAGKVVDALDQSTLGETVVRAKVDDPKSAAKASEKGRNAAEDS